MEWLFNFIESLNDYAGLFALLAVIVPCVIYWKQRRNERQAMQDELDAMNEHTIFPMSGIEKMTYTREVYLRKRLKR
jgi:lipopolysaccharide export system protein LptC